jgi:hypothetical protein
LRCGEAARVADVAENVGGDDRPDAVQLEQCRLGVLDSVGDAGSRRGDLLVEASHVGQ